ncbi:ArnT family glycosyltransferase [Salinifilum aidingensis]
MAVCALAGALYLWGIGDSWGNTYYSAAVRSMSQSFENFFFGSFDAAGVITVDKPPMALWLQVLSVHLLGFNAVAVLLPQALAGVAAVFALHRTVRRWAGEHAALLAALVLALTPITVVINRDNNPDTLLVLLVLLAAYALTRALDSQRSTAWLALAAFLVGCGFLTKMLQAWMVLPAFIAAFLVGSRSSWPRRALDLGAAAVVLVVSSFWWVAATALWPEPKPWIGGSSDGSAWDLVFGYNGFGRVLGGRGQGPGGGFSGEPGALRLANEQLGGQISWLLPLCLLVLLAVGASGLRHRAAGRERIAGWVLWGGWFGTLVLAFSFASGTVHPYYTTMLAPAVGAITGAGTVRFWRWYREPRGASWLLLPAATAVTAAWAFALVARDPDWHGWAGYLALALAAAAVALLLLRGERPARAGLAVALAAVLCVPAVWSAEGAFGGGSAMGGTNPTAGPGTAAVPGGSGGGPPAAPRSANGQRSGDPGGGPSGGRPAADGSLSGQQRAVLHHVQRRAADAEVPLAVEGGAMTAAPFALNSGTTVVGMGGFTGSDDAPSAEQLGSWQRAGELGFVLLGGGPGGGAPGGGPGGPGGDSGDRSPGRRGAAPSSSDGPGGGGPGGGEAAEQRRQWVQQHCAPVDPASYGGSSAAGGDSTNPSGSGLELYSCR